MDSENDKKLTRWLLTINMTQSQMREMGVDPQTNLQQTSNISSISSRGLSQTYTSGAGRKKRSNATYHGRRKETTMFINKRVRCKDFLKLLNKRRKKEGKAPLKRTTAVWNRSKLRRLRTVQSSNHLGKGLWSCNKNAKS